MSVRNDIIANLISEVKAYVVSDDCPALIQKVAPFHFNYQMEFKNNTPVLMVIDQGNEQRAVADATHDRYIFDVMMAGYLKGPTYENMRLSLNDIQAAIKDFVNSSPSLGDNVLAVQYVEGLAHAIDADKNQGETASTIRIIYWCVKGTY